MGTAPQGSPAITVGTAALGPLESLQGELTSRGLTAIFVPRVEGQPP